MHILWQQHHGHVTPSSQQQGKSFALLGRSVVKKNIHVHARALAAALDAVQQLGSRRFGFD
jgi:hypothetical protein